MLDSEKPGGCILLLKLLMANIRINRKILQLYRIFLFTTRRKIQHSYIHLDVFSIYIDKTKTDITVLMLKKKKKNRKKEEKQQKIRQTRSFTKRMKKKAKEIIEYRGVLKRKRKLINMADV